MQRDGRGLIEFVPAFAYYQHEQREEVRMAYQQKDEERESGNQQDGGQEPIIIETPIEVDWGKKGEPQKDSTNTDHQTEKK